MAVVVGSIVFIVLMLLGMFKFISPVPNLMNRLLFENLPLAVLQNGEQVFRIGLLLNWGPLPDLGDHQCSHRPRQNEKSEW